MTENAQGPGSEGQGETRLGGRDNGERGIERGSWRSVLAWSTSNPATVTASLSALGFVIGGIIIASFAAGLGVAPVDLGVDLRGTLTVAAGVLLYPAGAVLAYELQRPSSRLERSIQVFAIAVLQVTILLWWVVGLPLLIALISGSVLGLIASLIEFFLGDETANERTRRVLSNDALRSYVAVLVSSGTLIAMAAWAYGHGVRDDAGTGFGSPKVVEFVLPVTRGVISVGETSLCVDRVGANVVVGHNTRAVLTRWDSFLVMDCPRDDVSILVTPYKSGG